MTIVPRFLVRSLAPLLLLAACGGKQDAAGRLVLRAEAAARLELRGTTFVEMDPSAVPRAAREQAGKVRDGLGGDGRVVRYYASADGDVAILIPSRSFEGEDPHVVMGMRTGADRPATTVLRSYEAVRSYCPGEGALGEYSAARDSADGCRYFTPVPAPPPG